MIVVIILDELFIVKSVYINSWANRWSSNCIYIDGAGDLQF